MLKALKASKRNSNACSLKVVKLLKADRSILKYPGPRTAPLLEVPKALTAGTPKAQTPLSTPAVVQGVAEGSVPNQPLMLRPTTRSFLYWLTRFSPSLFALFDPPVKVCGKPE